MKRIECNKIIFPQDGCCCCCCPKYICSTDPLWVGFDCRLRTHPPRGRRQSPDGQHTAACVVVVVIVVVVMIVFENVVVDILFLVLEGSPSPIRTRLTIYTHTLERSHVQ